MAAGAGRPRAAAQVEKAYNELERSGGRRGTGLTQKTLANVHGILHKALADAVRWGKVARNVVDLVDAPRPEKTETTVWDLDQLRAFLRHVESDEYYALWLLFATTGLRRGEALGLRLPDVDFEQGLVTIRQTLGSLHGKPVWKPRPKTEASARALDPMTVRALREHRKAQAELRLLFGKDWQAEPPDARGVAMAEVVFTWPDSRLISPERVSKWFDRHVRAAGLPKCDFTTSAIRRTAGLCALPGCFCWWEPRGWCFRAHNPGGRGQCASESSQPIREASRVQSGRASGVSGS